MMFAKVSTHLGGCFTDFECLTFFNGSLFFVGILVGTRRHISGDSRLI